MTVFEILDSVPGTGKTQSIIQMIDDSPQLDKFLYVTPFKSETERVATSVKTKKVHIPEDGKTTKTADIMRLVRQGKTIATTHSLFEIVSTMPDFIELIEKQGYHLLLDEVISSVQKFEGLHRSDVELLHNHTDLIEVDDIGKVTWKGDKIGAATLYRNVYDKAKKGVLYIVGDYAFINLFNDKLLKAFQAATVATYLFQSSQMRMLLDLHEIKYELKSVKLNEKTGQYVKIKHDIRLEPREKLRQLMNVHMDAGQRKYNERFKKTDVRLSHTGLTKAIAENDTAFFEEAGKIIRAFFTACERREPGKCYYSTLQAAVEHIKPKDYDKDENRMSISERATNKYIDGKYLAYIYERNMNPINQRFFTGNGVSVDDEAYRVAEFLQWVFRSQVRKGEPVEVLLPSEKMRTALNKWANYQI